MRLGRTMFLLAALALAQPAWAGSSEFGQITGIGSSGNGVNWFTMSSGHQNAPACQGRHVANRWAMNTNSSGGQALWATILTAYSLRKQVYVVGTTVCTDLGDTETAGYVDVVG